jgi:hypothetical protein
MIDYWIHRCIMSRIFDPIEGLVLAVVCLVMVITGQTTEAEFFAQCRRDFLADLIT